jgi:SAM-dependent methyltransferase
MEQEPEEYYGDLAKFYDWRMEGDEKDIPFYVQLAKEYGGPVLELGCGTGRITLPIAKAGIEAVGLDLSGPMLDVARYKLSRMSREVQNNMQFVQGNMSDFSLEGRFSLIILPNNQFRELMSSKDQLSCLRCIGFHLNEGGNLIIDLINPFRSVSYGTTGDVFHRKVGYCEESGTIVECLFKTISANFMQQWIETETIYIEHLDDGTTIRHTGRDRLRYIFPGELDLLLENSGFEVKDRWGGYDRGILEDDSLRMIICARKSAESSKPA